MSVERIKHRKSQFELMRIIAMLMVVMGHFILSVVMNESSSDKYVVFLQEPLLKQLITTSCIMGSFGVGIFFIITGYFNGKKTNVSWDSCSNMILSTVYYALLSVIFVGLFTFLSRGGGTLSIDKSTLVLQTINLIVCPVSGSTWWFITSYVILLLLSPTINRILNGIPNKRGMLIILGYMYISLFLFGKINSRVHDVYIAVFYYSIGVMFGGIRVEKSKKWWNNTILLIIIIVSAIVINGVSQFQIIHLLSNVDTENILVRKFWSFISEAIQPVGAMGIFLLIAKKQMNNRIINSIANKTLGVYLFHAAPFISTAIWTLLRRQIEPIVNLKVYYLYLFGTPMVIFLVAVLSETIKNCIFRATRINDRVNNFIKINFRTDVDQVI